MATKKYPAKDANDSLDYVFDWAEFLVEGETISSATVTASTPEGADPLTIAGIVTGVDTVTFRASAGEVGQTYTITCQVTTSAGNTVNRKATLAVKDL